MTPVTFEFPSCCCQSLLRYGPKNERLAPANSPTYISKLPVLNSASYKFLSPNPIFICLQKFLITFTNSFTYVHKNKIPCLHL